MILKVFTSDHSWTQQRTPTTNILLRIRIAHGLPICAEMQSAFYLFALPQGTFHVFQLFRNGKYIGLDPSVEYRPSCRFLPMGWASSVGIMQQVSRQVLLMKGLPKSLETQKVDGIPRWFTQAVRVQALKGRGGKCIWIIFFQVSPARTPSKIKGYVFNQTPCKHGQRLEF